MGANSALRKSSSLPAVDARLVSLLSELSKQDKEFWSFEGSRRTAAHAYFQYPAMMVPAVQRALLGALLTAQPGVQRVLEPFAGAGTILVESMYAGLAVHGQDLNPLAVLLCQAKIGPFNNADIREASIELLERITADHSTRYIAEFPGLAKWFSKHAAIQLSRISRAIRSIRRLDVRRFLWIVLCETVRRTSNSRTSTYKLHIRAPDDRPMDPMPVFESVLRRNLSQHARFTTQLRSRGNLDTDGEYVADISIALRDARLPIGRGVFDALMTSPPYGDNRTTVPYGQYSYLPLQWVDLADIPGAEKEMLRSTHEIDSRSLGGVVSKGAVGTNFEYLWLLDRSKSLRQVLYRRGLAEETRRRVLPFIADLDRALSASLEALRSNAYGFWTVGNRRVAGRELPLDDILAELSSGDAVLVTDFSRRIHSKRMANRNDTTRTMSGERILVFRKK